MLRNRVLLLCSLLVGLFISELGLRLYDYESGKGLSSKHRNLLKVHGEKKPIRPFRVFGKPLYTFSTGKPPSIRSVHDELYVLKKPEGIFRIVCFGGSTTEQKVDGVHYPGLVQKKLRERLDRDTIEVVNVGYSAYTTAHSVVLLALDVLSWLPDLVIFSHNINDLQVMLWLNLTYNYATKYSHLFYTDNLGLELWTATNLLFQQSSLYWLIRQSLFPLVYVPVQRKDYLHEPIPLAEEIFRRNLKTFIILAHSIDAKVLLAS